MSDVKDEYEVQRDNLKVLLDKNDILGLRKDIKENRATLGEVKSDVSDIKDRVGRLETDVAVIKDNVSVLETDVKEVKSDVKDILKAVSKDQGVVEYKSAQWKTAGIAIGILAAIAGAVLQILQLIR